MAVPSRARKGASWSRIRILRRLTQAGFALFIIASSIRHYVATSQHLASIDAYCPFGGFETIWRWLSSGGLYVQKTHQSNLVLMLGLVAGVILGGGAFCGWICPFGALQDLLNWVRRMLRLPEISVPTRLDRILTYGRYLVLAGILYATISTVRLWFADYDPYRTIFGLGWIFEFNLAEHWPAYVVALAIVVGALVIPRFWCRYLCPLGSIGIFNKLSILTISLNPTKCTKCENCLDVCPMSIDELGDIGKSSDCILCGKCVEACQTNALRINLRRFNKP